MTFLRHSGMKTTVTPSRLDVKACASTRLESVDFTEFRGRNNPSNIPLLDFTLTHCSVSVKKEIPLIQSSTSPFSSSVSGSERFLLLLL